MINEISVLGSTIIEKRLRALARETITRRDPNPDDILEMLDLKEE